MKEKRRDSKGRILHTGESQRTDGKYLYKYVDAFGNTKYVYAWRLTPTDPTPKGKREKPSLRELEQQIRRDIEDGIDSTGKKMTLCQLYAKQNLQRANVKKSTQKQREQLMRLLKEDKLGARSIDAIKPSDAKEWALRMKDKGFSYILFCQEPPEFALDRRRRRINLLFISGKTYQEYTNTDR